MIQEWIHATPYGFALAVVTVLGLSAVAFVWRRRERPGGRFLLAMMAVSIWWSLLYVLELSFPGLQIKILLDKFQYPGIVSATVLWYLFARAYALPDRRLTWPRLISLWIVPTATIVLLVTNGLHHLVWRGDYLEPLGPSDILVVQHGPWFWVQVVYSYAMLLAGIVVLLSSVRRKPLLSPGRAALLVAAVVVPWAGNVLAVFVLGLQGIDPTPFAFVFAGMLIALACSRLPLHRLLPALLSAARHRLLERMKDAVVVLDFDGRVVNMNAAASDLLARHGVAVGGRAEEILPDACLAPFGRANEFHSELTLEDGSGRCRFLDVVSSPLGGDGVRVGRLLVLRDVTEMKVAEQALRESEEKFRSIIEQFAEGFYLTDDLGRVVEWNRAMESISGRMQAYVLGRPVPGLRSELDDAKSQSAGKVVNAVIVRPDGEERNIQETVFPVQMCDRIGLGHVARDVTDEREMEQALRLTQISVNGTSDSIFWLNSDGRLVYANDASCRRLGYEREELLNMHVQDIDPGAPVPFGPHFRDVQNRGSIRFETNQRTKDGRLLPAEIVSSYVAYEGQEYLFAHARDIAERKEAERALQESEEQLRQAQKMEAVGQLAGGIAHDFNNLLMVIIGNASLALADLGPDDPKLKFVTDIKQAGERAAGLTRQILAFSRRQMLQPRVVQLNDVVTGMEPLLRRTLGEHIDLLFLQAPDLRTTEVDPHQIEQVLMNLAINARDAMPKGGLLTVETANVELDGAFCALHPAMNPGTHVMLVVSDTGCGMPEHVVERAFEPFFTTKEVGKGTGLGLSTVFGIVKQSGGTITVRSRPGEGSTFRVYLPACTVATVPDAVSAPAAAALGGLETILVVEDEPAARELLARVLKGRGYRVLQAESGRDVERTLADGERRPDLLLTDVVLPGGQTGRDVAEALLAQNPDLPVIFMSGYARDAMGREGKLDGGLDFLQKPFSPDTLLLKVRALLDGSVA